MAVRVSAPARLHLGLLDLRGDLGRLFGSLGVAVAAPRLVISAHLAPRLSVSGEGAAGERVERVAHIFLQRYGPPGGAHLCVEQAIPAHAGLGSGTQIALVTGTALARLYGLRLPVAELAATLDRGRHSGIGTAIFKHGGFVVDGGRAVGEGSGGTVPPVIVRQDVPPAWHFVAAIPAGGGQAAGLSGAREDAAFDALPRPDEAVVGHICRLVLMRLLPALVEGEIGPVGAAITEIQALVDDCFAPAQGGRYATALGSELIGAMLAAGAGQRSWGPAVFGLVATARAAEGLQAHLRGILADRPAQILVTPAENDGARVEDL